MSMEEKMMQLSFVVGELQAEVKQLRERNKLLEEQNKQIMDTLAHAVKKRIETIPAPYGPYTKCFTCGIEGVNGYVCTRNDCPTAVRC